MSINCFNLFVEISARGIEIFEDFDRVGDEEALAPPFRAAMKKFRITRQRTLMK